METAFKRLKKIKYDGSIAIATGASKKAKTWKNKTIADVYKRQGCVRKMGYLFIF